MKLRLIHHVGAAAVLVAAAYLFSNTVPLFSPRAVHKPDGYAVMAAGLQRVGDVSVTMFTHYDRGAPKWSVSFENGHSYSGNRVKVTKTSTDLDAAFQEVYDEVRKIEAYTNLLPRS